MLRTTDLEEQDLELREAAFYERPFYFSYSSLNMLLEAPKDFYYQYVLGFKSSKRERYLTIGSATHFLLLPDDLSFDDTFVVATEGVPTGKGKELIEEVFEIYKAAMETNPREYELEDFTEEILELMKEMDYHQRLKDDEKRLAKVIDQQNKDYFNYLVQAQTKEMIDAGMLDLASLNAQALRENDQIKTLMGVGKVHDRNSFGIYNEYDHQIEAGDLGLPFGLKGRIDNITVDVQQKKIFINDLKTTGGKLQDFESSVEKWNYSLQAAIYVTLVLDLFKDVIDDSWEITFHFIVVDRYRHTYAFPVSANTLKEWTIQMQDAFKQAKFHYENHDYKLPYAFVAKSVVL